MEFQAIGIMVQNLQIKNAQKYWFYKKWIRIFFFRLVNCGFLVKKIEKLVELIVQLHHYNFGDNGSIIISLFTNIIDIKCIHAQTQKKMLF